MLQINLRQNCMQASARFDIDSICQVALDHGILPERVSEIKSKLIWDLSTPARGGKGESSALFIAKRLFEGWEVYLILDWRKDVDEPINDSRGYKSSWVNSLYTIAFRQPIHVESAELAGMRNRLAAYEKVFGCAGMSIEEILSLASDKQPVVDDGAGNRRGQAQFDEPDEPSLFVEGDEERLNPYWVLYTTNYHRGLLTKEQVENVGNNMLTQLQQCSAERLAEIGPRGIPKVLTKYGHVSMAWVVYFKNTHKPDLNFAQITRLGLTVAEQVKEYTPRG